MTFFLVNKTKLEFSLLTLKPKSFENNQIYLD